MMKRKLRSSIHFRILLVSTLCPLGNASGADNNNPPEIAIVWPHGGDGLAAAFPIKIKTDISSNAGVTVTQVQFFAETNLIGTVTNAPFNLVWQVWLNDYDPRYFDLKAVAVDSLGRRVESTPVRPYYSNDPLLLVVEMLSPRNGTVFAAPATFVFAAEVFASLGDAGPVEFLVDDNSVGVVSGSPVLRATNPPVSVVVSNLAVGEHRLRVKYLGGAGGGCSCNWITNTIRVVRLELRSPRLTPQARFQCEVMASLPGIKTIIQASPDLVGWAPIATNQPPGTTFTFTDTHPATNTQVFYRVALPPP